MLITEFKHPWVEAVHDPDPFWPLYPGSEGPRWELQEDHPFSLAFDTSRTFTIPKGYIYDKASVPPIFWGFPFYYTPDGTCSLAALEHDFLCDILTGGSDWLKTALGGTLPVSPLPWEVHLHFRTRLYQCHTRFSKAETMGNAVAAFGPKGWFWDVIKWGKNTEHLVVDALVKAKPLVSGTTLGTVCAVAEAAASLTHPASAPDKSAESGTQTP